MQYVNCDRAEKHGNLCLGYGYEEIDEPCEQCKNCIKCEGGSYQLGETEKDERIEKLQEQIGKMKCCQNCADGVSCENSGLVYVCEKWELRS